ncbi:MAG: PIG-L family deacetylase [Elusimicrobia bacterium]|nr:PIG-L family deacetylase [Elusimicrobiota bacterium]
MHKTALCPRWRETSAGPRQCPNRRHPPVSADAAGLFSKYAGLTILGVGAHPDDLELGAGGTLARLSRAGARVVMAVVSIPSHLERRRQEASRAADILGCEVRFLNARRCLRVEDLKNHELVTIIDRLVKELRPAALLSHCLANFHEDRKLVYNACVSSQRLHYFDFYCYGPTSCVPVNIAFNPHMYVDITSTIQQKMDAIKAHGTQFRERSLGTEHYLETANRTGRIIGVDYAEGLEIIRMRIT